MRKSKSNHGVSSRLIGIESQSPTHHRTVGRDVSWASPCICMHARPATLTASSPRCVACWPRLVLLLLCHCCGRAGQAGAEQSMRFHNPQFHRALGGFSLAPSTALELAGAWEREEMDNPSVRHVIASHGQAAAYYRRPLSGDPRPGVSLSRSGTVPAPCGHGHGAMHRGERRRERERAGDYTYTSTVPARRPAGFGNGKEIALASLGSGMACNGDQIVPRSRRPVPR